MDSRYPDDARIEEAGSWGALIAVVVVLIVIVVLFLLFKFNFFNGGSSHDIRTT